MANGGLPYMGETVLMKDSQEECVVEKCNHRRYWHNGNEGDADCSRLDCPCKAGKYPSDQGGDITALQAV